MGTFYIKKGKDIKLKGAAEAKVVELSLPAKVAVQPPDFRGLKLRLAVKEGFAVKRGTTLLTDKVNPDIKILSPIAGRVSAIVRGDKRALLRVVVEAGSNQDVEIFQIYRKEEISNLPCTELKKALLDGGVWCALRQRPFSKVANPQDTPKAIFVHAMSTEPLALDIDVALEGQEELFQAGLNALSRLTDGKVHLCTKAGVKSKALTQAKNVDMHRFSGPHPAGNVSTHINLIAPLNKGDLVWYVEAQDVLNIAKLLTQGTYPNERIVALTGEGVAKAVYAKTIIGAPLSLLLQGSNLMGRRCLSGSILAGKNVGADGYVCFYDSQVTVIAEGGKREFLGWLSPGFKKYTFSRTFLSALTPQENVSLDTDEHGGHRAIVLNNLFDSYVALDIYTFFLLKAILAEDLDEAEQLGILECDEEDFALASFACPSKTNVGEIIRQGLDMIEKEG